MVISKKKNRLVIVPIQLPTMTFFIAISIAIKYEGEIIALST
jgi:hypothetical protein